MMNYRDRTFCASEVEVHTCDRELSEEDAEKAKKMELPIAYGDFCKEERCIACEREELELDTSEDTHTCKEK